jgi:hypothetical protein
MFVYRDSILFVTDFFDNGNKYFEAPISMVKLMAMPIGDK